MTERLLHLIEKYPLNLVSHLSSGLPIILGLIFIKDLPRGFKLLLLLFALYFISDSYSLWLSVKQKSTYPIQNIQPLFEIWIAAAIYLSFIKKTSSRKWIFCGLLICSLIIVLSYKTDAISTPGTTTQRLFIATIALAYFNKILTDARIKYILLDGMFWVSAGLLIFSAGTFFFWLFSSYLFSATSSDREFIAFWYFNQILYMIFCLMSCFGIYVNKYNSENLI